MPGPLAPTPWSTRDPCCAVRQHMTATRPLACKNDHTERLARSRGATREV